MQRVDAFAGTSIGAVNAAFVACDADPRPCVPVVAGPPFRPTTIQKSESWFSRLRAGTHGRWPITGLFEIAQTRTDVLRANNSMSEAVKRQGPIFVTLSRGGAVGSRASLGLLKIESTRHYRQEARFERRLRPARQRSRSRTSVRLILASCSIPVAFPAVVDGRTAVL
ncbi:MAG: patatin-like phospholipase family protein [Bacillus subtilis]|nr:patatin-like phospholipase family protein [Bacillus subtilis]